jgi:hypothetical protein
MGNELLILLFGTIALMAAALAGVAIWTPRATAIRTLAVVLTALFVPLVYVAINEFLSRPKPLQQEWFGKHVAEATVLGVSVDEGKAIYLWLRLDQAPEPRYYTMPWQPRLAETLQRLIDEAIEEDATVKIVNPFGRKSFADLGELNARVVPPAVAPTKKPPAPPQFFNPRERSI